MTWEAARRWALKFYRADGIRRRIYGERSGTGWAYRVTISDLPAPIRKGDTR